MTTNVRTMPMDIGPHHRSWRSTWSSFIRPIGDTRNATTPTTRPRFEGLNMCLPFHRTTYFDSTDKPAIEAKAHQPRVDHQSPCSVPGTLRIRATPLPVTMALAGHTNSRRFQSTMTNSRAAHTPTDTRIWVIERSNPNTTCPRTWTVVMTKARCRRGSLHLGNTTGSSLPAIRTERAGGAAFSTTTTSRW